MTDGGANERASPASPAIRAQRVNMLFILVVSVIALAVVALMIAFALQSGLSERTRETVLIARETRAQVFSVADALIDLEAGRRALAQRRPQARNIITTAQIDARMHTGELLRRTEREPTLREAAQNYAALVEETLQLDTSDPNELSRADELRYQLRAAAATFVATTNAQIDNARGIESATRDRLDRFALLLGILALVASGLGLVALRRERAHWREAQAATEDARARAQASDLAKSRFLAAASHDMRQPLHALTLYLSALDRRVENPEAREILSKMERATQSMVGMFATLLDLARIQAGVIEPDKTDVPLQEIIDRVLAENPGGRVAAPRTSVAVHTDAVLFERVLRNLVANALRHGGGAARIELAERGALISVSVADNGPGISAEDQGRIFDEFIRLEGGRGAEGLGLGLSIVKRICTMLDLDLKLDSALGEGARFTVSVPRATTTPAAPTSEPDISDVLRGVPVLVVDDDTLAREAIAGAVRDLGAVVRTAEDQASAEAILAEGFSPKLVLNDLRIDGHLRGVDIANALRAQIEPAPIVIIVTGDTGPSAMDVLKASGHRWLIKPVDWRELCAAVSSELTPA